MQQGEGKAMKILNRFQEVTESFVSSYSGEIIKTYGDGSLILFESTIDALKCAYDMQIAFQEDPIVPLRIGIHIGEIVRKGNDVFGNGVNIASRIESMGQAGSVLMSNEAWLKIRNQEWVNAASLGRYKFKNVEEEIEVFALSNEGITVPHKNQIQGKFQSTGSQGHSNRLIRISLLAILVVFLAAISYFIKDQDSHTLSAEERDKRVAVMIFENETMDPGLDAFGKMVSDWVTRGLMETGEANVISAANIESKIVQAGGGKAAAPALAKNTNLGMIIHGRYYLQGENLIIAADIVDAIDGRVIHPLKQIDGPKEGLIPLLEELTEEILGFWVVRGQRRFLLNIPSYEAFQAYQSALPYLLADPPRAEKSLLEAAALDTNFYEPLFSLYSLMSKEGEDQKRQELLEKLSKKTSYFSRWEKHRYDEMYYVHQNNWLEAAKASEARFNMDQSDYSANHNSAMLFSYANYPQKALDIVRDFDPLLYNDQDHDLIWRTANESFYCYQLGSYDEVNRLAGEYSRSKFPAALAALHLKALVRMDSTQNLREQLDSYSRQGVYNISGRLTPPEHMMLMAMDELYLTDKEALLQEFTADIKDRVSGNPEMSQDWRTLGFAYFYEGDYETAYSYWDRAPVVNSNWPGWLRSTQEIDRLSRVGACLAKMGQESNAREIIESIKDQAAPYANVRPAQSYYISRVHLALGEKAEAVKMLEEAINLGFQFFQPAVYTSDPFLKELKGFQPFDDLVKPKA